MDVQYNNVIVNIAPLAWLVLAVFLIIQLRRKQNKSYTFFLLVFGVYLLYVLQVAFFPIQIDGGYADARRLVSNWTTDINLIPFYIPLGELENAYLFHFAILQFAENILLTIPFGFGISFVTRLRRKDFIWLPVAVGFSLETAQFILNLLLRYPYRVVDITDALLNTAGVFLGYALFRLFSHLFLKITSRLPNRPTGLLAYVQDVTHRA